MEHQGSPSRRRSTPARASSSSVLLVPASIARPSLGSRLFSGSNKENTSTPDNSDKNNNSARTPYDAFMSPLKSAMKAYPVMSPFKKRRISFASPLRQCSPNTSMKSRITERDEQDTTMTSATASVLDDLFQDDEHEQDDRTQEGACPRQQEEQQEFSTLQDTPILSLLHLHPPASAVECISEDIAENVTSHPAASPSKQSQTSTSSVLFEHEEAHNRSIQTNHAEVSSVLPLSPPEETLPFPPAPDITAFAANIPLPPSPSKHTSTHSPKIGTGPRKSNLMHTITKLAANIPLPNSPSPANLTQPRASTSKLVSQTASTPLFDKTAQAAMIALPQSSAPVARALIFQESPELAQDDTSISTEQIMPFADQDTLDSPVKATSSVLHQLPFARSSVIPSPLKQQHLIQAQYLSPEEQNAQPFAQVDSVDSPVRHAVKPDESDALESMAFANEQCIPSPAKPQLPVLQLSGQVDDVSMEGDNTREEEQVQTREIKDAENTSMDEDEQDDEEVFAANASRITISEAGSPLNIDAPEPDSLAIESVDEVDGQSEKGQDEVVALTADESRITISEAGSPLHTDAPEPEVLVPDAFEHGDNAEDLNAARANEDDTSDPEHFAPTTSATPARIVQRVSGQATPSLHAPPSAALLPTTHAPATKKRTLTRSRGEISQQDLLSSEIVKSSSSDILKMDAASQETPSEEQEESSMLQARTKVNTKVAAASSRSLKRKASTSSIVSRDDDGLCSEETIQPARRITRQRSLTALRDAQPEEVGDMLEVPTPAETPAPVISVKGKGRVNQQDEEREEAEAAVQEVKASSKVIPRTRRQSTRLASTSGLPQPKSRIAVKATTPRAVVSIATSQRADTNSRLEDSASSDEAEENVPTVSSRSSARPQATTPAEDVQTPAAAPVMRRPQRSARPARNLLPDAKPLPSPRRVMSPVKKPLRAARAVNTASTASRSNKSTGKDGSLPEPGSQTTSAKVAPRSPGRVLLSPAKSNSQPLRSPGRSAPYQLPRSPRQAMGSTFDWSSAPSHAQASTATRLPRTLSPDRYRTTASKIFGAAGESSGAQSSASSGPASSAASATGLTSQTSPFKGLALRLTLSGSPSLLGISVAPELLVLAPPSPSPTKIEDDSRASASAASSMLRVSTSSAPESRRFSTPNQASPQYSSPMQSPRRALSAQPTGAVPRHELPSPRRVPVLSRAASSGSHANMGTPVRTASRVFSAPLARPSALLTTQSAVSASTSTAQDIAQSTAADEAPRRSQRSARPQRAVQAIKKEGPPALVPGPSQVTRAKSAVTAAQLQSLTNQNTSANRKLYNKHKVTVIHKDEDRPPSPTSKIRKTGEEVSKLAKAESSKDGKTAKGALAQATKERQESAQMSSSQGEKRPHFTAAGDEGIYESPVKKARRTESENQQDAEKAAKRLKWDRDLLKASQKMYTPPGPGKSGGAKVPSRPVVKNKALELDGFGNVPDCKASLSPVVPRSKVDITKIIYRDDDEED